MDIFSACLAFPFSSAPFPFDSVQPSPSTHPPWSLRSFHLGDNILFFPFENAVNAD